MDVVGFADAVGREVTTAFTVRASIGEEDTVSLFQKHAGVSGDAFPVVTDAVQKDDRGTVVVIRTCEPGFEDNAIGCIDGYILKFGTVEFPCGLFYERPLCDGPPGWM